MPKLPYRPNTKESDYLTAGDQMEEKGWDNDGKYNFVKYTTNTKYSKCKGKKVNRIISLKGIQRCHFDF